MALPTILAPDPSSPLRIDIRFDHENVGAYELYLWDAAGMSRTLLKEGISEDAIEDFVELGPPLAEYHGRVLDCFVSVINPDPNAGDVYSAALIGSQHGNECEEKVISTGPIASSPVMRRLAARIAVGGM